MRALHLHGSLSRSQLVLRTGLTRSAVRVLVGELAAGGLVREEPSAPLGLPGRPSPVVRPRADAAAVLALEIAVDSLAAALVGFGGAVHERRRIDRPRRHLAADEIVADLVELAGPLLARIRQPGALLGVGVAVVGVVHREDGIVRLAPNLGWRNVPLGSMLAAALGLPVPVIVANEADLGALAEHRRGAAVGSDHALYISGEVGVGGGLIVDGHPLSGATGYAGEVGHLPVNPGGSPCGCGAHGCWETEIGERALLALAGEDPDGGRGAVDRVLASARRGEPRALAALEHVGRWLGIGLAGLVNTFNPGLVVLGGLFGRIQPFVAVSMQDALDARVLSASREHLRVLSAALGADAALLGAAELAMEPLLADPAAVLSRRAAASVASA